MNLPEDECAVKIVVRERPLPEIYQNNEVTSAINYHLSNSNILIVDERPFAFDHVLPPTVSQKELFDSLVMPLVGKVLKGFNCTALAYGQTGTGKSFTMGLNPESLEGENVGMIPRCVQEILDNKAQESNSDVKLEISASFIEIYSEKVYDLLSENPADPIIARGYKFTGGSKKLMANMQDGYALLNQGTKNRHVRPTKMNPQSSRSHAIFTIYVRSEMTDKITQSCLNLVDLAGSEGVRRTGHQGVALSEGVHINQGLLSIGKVLQAITHGYKVIPYRDSVLSSVLQDSLNPNSYFTLLACISPHREDLSETLSTLRFAQSAKNLKHNPQINSKLMELKKSKTPFKTNPLRSKSSFATPTPYKRPFSLVNSKPSAGPKNPTVHGNTFCTPSKKRKTENLKFNHTSVGLTPKEKQKIGSVKMPKVNKFSFEPRESLLDRYNDTSLDSRASLLSLNISTSTAIDAQPEKPSTTFSPIVRKCMAEMECTMKSSMLRVLESLKDNQCPQKTPLTPLAGSPMSLVDQKIRKIVRQELLSFTGEKTIKDPRQSESNVRCELFRASSPIFKMPETPRVRPLTDFYSSQTLDSTQNENFLNTDETVLSAKPLRRSARMSSKSRSFSTEESVVIPQRRSTRLSSMKTFNDARRQSIRLASHKEKPNQEDDEEDVVEVKVKEKAAPSSHTSKSIKKFGPTKKKSSALVNNSVIAGYFDENKEKQPTNVKSALAKHQKAILEMLNSASMKELQYLPQVGLKTAFQIVTQRTLHGKFKNFTQVSKLPIWRGKAWERFKEANNIS